MGTKYVLNISTSLPITGMSMWANFLRGKPSNSILGVRKDELAITQIKS